MRSWTSGARLAAVLVATAAPVPASAAGLLDVPFVSQSERLCGGAAAAMVLRYWGARGVGAEEFASLVDDEAGGIRQAALTGALRARGWTVLPLDPPGADGLERQIARGRPVLALVEDRPGRYHYIVVVGSTTEHVIYHDPALAPFRALDRAEFDRRWMATGRWGIAPVPCASCAGPGADAADGATPPVRAAPVAAADCGGLVAEGVRLAGAEDRAGSERALEAAVALCPASADAHLELAGLRFLERRWKEAETLATRAVALAPDSAHAWRVIASSRFVDRDEAGALEAWNRVREPQLDLVRVSGLARTRHRVVEDLVGLAPGALLTPASLARAARRVAELPAASATRVGYVPAAGGLAEVDVAIVERPLGPAPVTLAARAARAAVERELVADASSPTRGGERVTFAWRFWENRPAVTMRAASPSLFGVAGLWTIEGAWSRQPYANGDAVVAEERRHAGARYANWPTGTTRVEAGAGVDRWSGRSASAFVSGAVEQRLLDDRMSARAVGSLWPSSAGAFSAGSIGLAWRAGQGDSVRLRARGGFDAASTAAPLDLWPGAGAGHARAPRLRAHPLLDAGIVRGPVFGRRLAHAAVDARRKLLTRGPLHVDAVAFADAARAWRSLSGDPRIHVDVGGGLRFRAAGSGGAIAIDVARGLRDGRMAVIAGWEAAWPDW